MYQYDYLIVGAGLYGAKESMYTNMVPISSILPIKKCGSISISLPSLTTISILRLLYTRMNYTISRLI